MERFGRWKTATLLRTLFYSGQMNEVRLVLQLQPSPASCGDRGRKSQAWLLLVTMRDCPILCIIACRIIPRCNDGTRHNGTQQESSTRITNNRLLQSSHLRFSSIFFSNRLHLSIDARKVTGSDPCQAANLVRGLASTRASKEANMASTNART